MHIFKNERYPEFSLGEEAGWIPDAEIPDDALTAEDIADFRRVEALWEAWQERLGQLFQEAKANAETPT